jgi:hypothetical protein
MRYLARDNIAYRVRGLSFPTVDGKFMCRKLTLIGLGVEE